MMCVFCLWVVLVVVRTRGEKKPLSHAAAPQREALGPRSESARLAHVASSNASSTRSPSSTTAWTRISLTSILQPLYPLLLFTGSQPTNRRGQLNSDGRITCLIVYAKYPLSSTRPTRSSLLTSRSPFVPCMSHRQNDRYPPKRHYDGRDGRQPHHSGQGGGGDGRRPVSSRQELTGSRHADSSVYAPDKRARVDDDSNSAGPSKPKPASVSFDSSADK